MTTDSPARTDSASLRIGAEELELPIVRGAEGDDAIDIAQLRGETGLITYDPGLGNTGACSSAITFLDGEEGILRYRGYPIEQLAEHSTFLEVAYLLIWGELPTREQLDRFTSEVTHHTLIREEMAGAMRRRSTSSATVDAGSRIARSRRIDSSAPIRWA